MFLIKEILIKKMNATFNDSFVILTKIILIKNVLTKNSFRVPHWGVVPLF